MVQSQSVQPIAIARIRMQFIEYRRGRKRQQERVSQLKTRFDDPEAGGAMIRVLVVDDSATVRNRLIEIIAGDPESYFFIAHRPDG